MCKGEGACNCCVGRGELSQRFRKAHGTERQPWGFRKSQLLSVGSCRLLANARYLWIPATKKRWHSLLHQRVGIRKRNVGPTFGQHIVSLRNAKFWRHCTWLFVENHSHVIGTISLFDGEYNRRNHASTHLVTGSFEFFSSTNAAAAGRMTSLAYVSNLARD